MIDWDWKRVYLLAHPTCEVCGKRPSKDLDHAILGRDTNYKRYVDEEWNFQACCDICNRYTKKADCYEERMKALQRATDRYGIAYIREKLDAFPDKRS